MVGMSMAAETTTATTLYTGSIMNGFRLHTEENRLPFLVTFALLALVMLLASQQMKAQPFVWDVDTAMIEGPVKRPFAEAEIDAFTPIRGWMMQEADDDTRITWNKAGDTMIITSRAYAGAYVLTDPTTAEGAMRITVTGFGSTKLSVDFSVRAKAFDNPGASEARRAAGESADARVGGVVEIPLGTVPVRKSPGVIRLPQAGSFDLSVEWTERIFANLSDADISDGTGSAGSQIRFVDSNGFTSLLGPDAELFKKQSVSESDLQSSSRTKATIDESRRGFESYRADGGPLMLRLDLFANGEFVRGSSKAKEIHAEGYITGHLDIYIDRKVTSVERSDAAKPASLFLD